MTKQDYLQEQNILLTTITVDSCKLNNLSKETDDILSDEYTKVLNRIFNNLEQVKRLQRKIEVL